VLAKASSKSTDRDRKSSESISQRQRAVVRLSACYGEWYSVCESAMALYLIVITSFKSTINPITIRAPCPVTKRMTMPSVSALHLCLVDRTFRELHLCLVEKPIRTQWIKSWVHPRAGMKVAIKWEILVCTENCILIVQPTVGSLTEQPSLINVFETNQERPE
jgi:hypothetical protein